MSTLANERISVKTFSGGTAPASSGAEPQYKHQGEWLSLARSGSLPSDSGARASGCPVTVPAEA